VDWANTGIGTQGSIINGDSNAPNDSKVWGHCFQ